MMFALLLNYRADKVTVVVVICKTDTKSGGFKGTDSRINARKTSTARDGAAKRLRVGGVELE